MLSRLKIIYTFSIYYGVNVLEIDVSALLGRGLSIFPHIE